MRRGCRTNANESASARRTGVKPAAGLPGFLLLTVGFLTGCALTGGGDGGGVPHVDRWGIYALGLATEEVELIYSSSYTLSTLRLSPTGDRFCFSERIDGDSMDHAELRTLRTNGTDRRRLTDNVTWDLYPAWSPAGDRIAFLSNRDGTLDIFVMDAAGEDVTKLYDSGRHDADIDWRGDVLAFTRDSAIWLMDDDGNDARPITDPPRAGEWGNANLPFGDYDPAIHPDGTRIAFERLVSDVSPHGIYEILVIDLSTRIETPLTGRAYTQGLPSWSHDGDRIVYLVSAIDDVGTYDIHMMRADGSDNRSITPGYFPPSFLCHSPIFSADDATVYFVGEWWE